MKALLLSLIVLAAPAALAVDVEGYVYTADGTPVAKASVTAPAQRVTTDADGHFTLTAPADSIVHLEVKAEGLPPTKLLALAGDPPHTITVGLSGPEGAIRTTAVAMAAPRAAGAPAAKAAERNRTISGSVRIGKRTLANAPVTIHAMSETYTQPVNMLTDGKGHYRANVPPGRYYVSLGEGLGPRLIPANHARMYAGEEGHSMVDLTTATEASLDLELIAAPLITGKVVDAGDKPVARADVMLALSGRSALEFFHQPIVRTLPNGRFAVPAPMFPENERLELVVTPPRHSPTRSKPFLVTQAKDTTITLPKYEDVTIRVIDREGKPLDGSSVAYALGEETASFGGDAAMLLLPHVARRRVKTENGAVTLRLTTGEYELAATAPKYQPRTESRTVVRPASFDIRLEPGHAIRGRVRRGDQPVSGVSVMIRGGAAPRGERGAETDAKGNFVFDSLPRGTYTLAFFKHDELVDNMLTVEAPGEVDLNLPPAGSLQGRVIDAETRTPVAQFMYTLETLDPERANERSLRGGQTQRGGSGADGTFSARLPVGRYRIVANATGYLPSEPVEFRVVERAPATVELTLNRGASISGRVLDEEGKPLLEANVMVVQEAGDMTRSARSSTPFGPSAATTGEDGAFTITGLQTGPAQLVVRRSGYALERRQIDIEPETRVDVTLSRGLSLTGVVTLRGKPAAGVSVDAGTSAINADHQSAMTDERGRFTLEGLIAARYTINANKDQYHAQLENVDVAQRREIAIELEGKGTAVVFGTVTGLPRSGSKARGTVFVQARERGAEGQIDAAGNYRIENAPAGTVDVVAHLESQQGARSTMRKKVELAPGQTLRVDLDLTPALVVTGRVTHGSGKPVARAHIVFHGDDAGMISAITREDGSYEAGLPGPGRYQIFASSEELLSRHYQTVREIRGSETFDIHLAEQTVEGVVLDAATGQPLPNALVTLVPRQSMPGQMQQVTAETMTGASGRFTMTIAAQGRHLLIASAQGYAQRSQEVSAGGPAIRTQFELTAMTELLRVRVVDAKNRTPLEAHLVLADEKGHVLPLRPSRSPDGLELVFSLAPGKYRLTVTTMGYPDKTVEVVAPGTAVIAMD